jgi:hypothetical protein
MFDSWLTPIFSLLSFFGFGLLTIVEDNNNVESEEEQPETPQPEDEEGSITDDTNLYDLTEDQIDEILDSDEVDIDKYLNLIKKGEKEIFLKDIKKPLEEEVETSKDKELPEGEAKEEIQKEEVKPEVKPEGKQEEKPVHKTNFKITDEFIAQKIAEYRQANKDNPQVNQMTEDYRKILEGIKGDLISDRALKNYVNAQLYIKSVKNPFSQEFKPDETVVKTQEYIQKANEAKSRFVLQAVKSKFPTFPEDGLTNEESRLDFERDLMLDNPRKFREYEDTIQNAEKDVNESYDKWYYITQNWESIAKDTINQEVDLFKGWLESKGVKPEDINLPELKLDEKNFYNEFIFKNVLYNEKGQPNEQVIAFMDNKYPVVKPMTVFNTLKDLFFDSILDVYSERARKDGFNTGKEAIVEPSLSESNLSRNAETTLTEEEMLEDDDTPLEKIREIREKIKQRWIGKKK